MRSSPFERLWRPKSLRSAAIVVAIVCASNMIGCHGGRRTSMRPRFFTSTTRSQAVVQGYTAVETPGAIVQQEQGAIIQQQQGAIVQQEQGSIIQQQPGAVIQQQPNAAPGGQASEPPIILEPRQGGTTSSVVPSFGDAQQPIDSNPTSLTPRKEGANSSVIDSLAPPAEAPQVILEKPPIGNLDGPKTTSSTPIDSTVKKPDSAGPEEPRLEVIPPGTGSGVKEPAAPAGSSGKEPAAAKTSAWKTQKPESSQSRITYQASSRKSVGTGKPGDPLGVID